MGLGILSEVADNNLLLVRAWGQSQVARLCELHPDLLAPSNPRDSLMRFSVLRNSFFDYRSVELLHVSDEEAVVEVRYGMGKVAEEAAALQTMGFFEKLIQLAGGLDVAAWFSSQAWSGGENTIIELRWRST
jgi:hypothetical protein